MIGFIALNLAPSARRHRSAGLLFGNQRCAALRDSQISRDGAPAKSHCSSSGTLQRGSADNRNGRGMRPRLCSSKIIDREYPSNRAAPAASTNRGDNGMARFGLVFCVFMPLGESRAQPQNRAWRYRGAGRFLWVSRARVARLRRDYSSVSGSDRHASMFPSRSFVPCGHDVGGRARSVSRIAFHGGRFP